MSDYLGRIIHRATRSQTVEPIKTSRYETSLLNSPLAPDSALMESEQSAFRSKALSAHYNASAEQRSISVDQVDEKPIAAEDLLDPTLSVRHPQSESANRTAKPGSANFVEGFDERSVSANKLETAISKNPQAVLAHPRDGSEAVPLAAPIRSSQLNDPNTEQALRLTGADKSLSQDKESTEDLDPGLKFGLETGLGNSAVDASPPIWERFFLNEPGKNATSPQQAGIEAPKAALQSTVEVHVSIGHIEVRSTTPPRPIVRTPAQQHLTLNDYLSRRNGDKR